MVRLFLDRPLERTHSLRKLVALGKRYEIEAMLSEDDMDFIDSVYRGRYPAEEGLLPTGAPTREEAERIIRAVSQSRQHICQITYAYPLDQGKS